MAAYGRLLLWVADTTWLVAAGDCFIAGTQGDKALWMLDRAAIRAVEFNGFWVSEVGGINIGATG